MNELTTNDIVRLTGELVVQKATEISNEEIAAYIKENSNEIFDEAIRPLVIQRATSQLAIQTCNFKCSADVMDELAFREHFNTWFTSNEEAPLRKMCHYTIKKEQDARKLPDEENLSFTERYLRKVQEDRMRLDARRRRK